MLDALTAFETLFQRSPVDPSVAAAVTVLTSMLLPLAPSRVEAALRSVAPHLSDDERAGWITVLMQPMRQAGITTPRCAAAFLGQCAVESAGFQSLEEDLGYTAVRLCQVWPTRFPNSEAAAACALQPEILANRVYSNRMGNGNEASGDGWRFRGRGLIQISGRTAYTHFAQAMTLTLDQAIEHAATQAGAVDSAIWFWSANQLNVLANSWSVDSITRKINGGMTGAAERSRLCETALHAIGV
jgi:putative chitinase